VNRSLKNSCFLLTLCLAISVFILSCNDSSKKGTSMGETTISGVVGGPIAKGQFKDGKSILSRIKDFFNIAKPAEAQEEIEVTATQNGEIVDTALVVDGTYELTVPGGGEVKLDFITSSGTFTLIINVTPFSNVQLDVDLQLTPEGPLLVINTFDITSPQISTAEEESFSFIEPDANLTVDGQGGSCVVASGGSVVDILVQDLTLDNCEDGVVAVDSAEVNLEADATPTLTINASNNGIRGANQSFVGLTGIDIFITADNNGVLTENDSDVNFNPSGNCVIEGGVQAVDQRDSSSVDTDDCELISGAVPTPTPTASPTTPTPTPTASPTPTPTPTASPTPTPAPPNFNGNYTGMFTGTAITSSPGGMPTMEPISGQLAATVNNASIVFTLAIMGFSATGSGTVTPTGQVTVSTSDFGGLVSGFCMVTGIFQVQESGFATGSGPWSCQFTNLPVGPPGLTINASGTWFAQRPPPP
jgi:hypothetical protein